MRLGPLLRWLVIPLLVISCLVWTAALSLPDDELHVSILDVGQGDSILIQTPDRQKVLIDGGPGIQGAVTRIGERLPFWDRAIDLIILTQPQADHLTGLLSVLERYNVGKIIEPGITYSSAGYRRWQDATARSASRSTARAGQNIELGRGIRLEILHPGERLLNGTGDDINNNAMVVRLTWDKVSFLLASDIANEGELELLTRRTEVRSTVLKVAHHGSRTSSSARFLDAVNPEVAVISAGRDNSFSHPHPEVVSRLVKQVGEDRLYVTAAHGTVEFTTNGQRLWVKTER
jgi:competence protein ComEC